MGLVEGGRYAAHPLSSWARPPWRRRVLVGNEEPSPRYHLASFTSSLVSCFGRSLESRTNGLQVAVARDEQLHPGSLKDRLEGGSPSP